MGLVGKFALLAGHNYNHRDTQLVLEALFHVDLWLDGRAHPCEILDLRGEKLARRCKREAEGVRGLRPGFIR